MNSINSFKYLRPNGDLINMAQMSKILIKHEFTSATALSTLAARDALQVSAQYGTLSGGGYLMKRIRGEGRLTFLEPGDGGILVLAYSDATVAEVEAALENADADLTADELVDQAQARTVVGIIGAKTTLSVGSGGTAKNELFFDLSDIDLPSKGLPFPEGIGWQWIFYNTSAGAMTTGAAVTISARYMGVKLQ